MSAPVVLVVDDQEHIRKLISVSLEICGYQVFTARDGVDALRCLATRDVDLVLTDWAMPEMGGAELVKHINEHFQSLPIVVVSCVNSPPSREEYSAMGILQWMRKPFRIMELQSLVVDILNDKKNTYSEQLHPESIAVGH